MFTAFTIGPGIEYNNVVANHIIVTQFVLFGVVDRD